MISTSNDGPVSRKPYTAVKRISRIVAKGKGDIKPPARMDWLFENNRGSKEHLDSIGASLNLGVNELADVLHRFYLSEVK